jgi:prepilin-type N-terminal cleavage/methylation domain-containing protein
MYNRRSAFTLIEIMIVVTIIGVLLSIAVPNFTHAREVSQTKACISNLKKIQWAKESFINDANKPTSYTPAATDLYGADKYIEVAPFCPSGGTYTIGTGSDDPTCSAVGHVIP